MQLKDIVRSIPVVPDGVSLEELGGGNVNQTWKLSSQDDAWVLRIDTPLARRLALNRADELHAMQAAQATGLVPEVVWTDITRGIFLTRFISGRPWRNEGPDALAALAAVLDKLHGVQADLPAVDLGGRAARYAGLLATELARQLADEVAVMAAEWCADSTRYALCHNDPGPANVLWTLNGLVLLDWEYAAYGEPCFDLAVVAAANQLDSDACEVLLHLTGREADADRLAGCRQLYDRLAALWLMVVCGSGDAPELYKSQLQTLIDRLGR